jgi:phosphatidate cytidylyltransferase
VAASLPGVESGLVGFGDVSGTESESEESYEAAEQAASSDLAMRIGSALVIFGLFMGSLLLGGWWFTTFVILLMIVSVGEFYATLRTRGYRPLALFGLAGVALIGVGAHDVGPMAIAGWAAATTAATVLFYSLTPRRNVLANTSVTILGLTWTGMLAFAILIAGGPHPVAHIIFLVLVIASNDVGGYFVGRSFGRRPLAPNVSPNKTLEGFIGGLVLSAMVAAVLAVFPPWEEIGITRALVTAGLIGILAPIGDLAESMVKRNLGVKDMGSVLPGHGGMLDRIDGFLFAVPAAYILFRGFGLL